MTPIDIGRIVKATVQAGRPFGLFLDAAGETVFVHLPEVAWFNPQDRRLPTERFQTGEVVDVLIYGYDHRKRQYIGSIRRANSDGDPYRALVPDGPALVGT